MNIAETYDRLARLALQPPPAPKPPPTPKPPAIPIPDLLRACPPDHLPPAAPDAPPDNSAFRVPNSALGTPAAKSWDLAWLEAVNAAESRLGRRICGARTLDGTPCELPSNHPTGRCRFHGGFDLTGAPPGNRNAYIHGLYSRRLKTCGNHCPNWSSCPMAAPEVLDVPLPKRPVCPYEQAEYNHALADALDLSCSVNHQSPMVIHIAHNIATLQVMLGRATNEMANSAVVAQTHAQSEKHSLPHEQVRPHINAITRIGAELRKYIALLSKSAPNEVPWNTCLTRKRLWRNAQAGPDPDEFDYVPPDPDIVARERAQRAKSRAQKAVVQAVQLAAENKDAEAIDLMKQASEADKTYTQTWLSALRRSVKTTATGSPPP